MDYILADDIFLVRLADIIFAASGVILLLTLLAMGAVTLIDSSQRRRPPAERRFKGISRLSTGRWPLWFGGTAILGIVAAIGVGLMAVSVWHGAVADEIEESYGIELSEKQISELNYPTRALSVDEPLLLGSTSMLTADEAGSYELTEIVLLWDKDGPVLTDLRGELTPLQAR